MPSNKLLKEILKLIGSLLSGETSEMPEKPAPEPPAKAEKTTPAPKMLEPDTLSVKAEKLSQTPEEPEDPRPVYIHRNPVTDLPRSGFQVDENPKKVAPDVPVCLEGAIVLINSGLLRKWLNTNQPPYRLEGMIRLGDIPPSIRIVEDGRLQRVYDLGTEQDEYFSGKYLQFTALAYLQGDPQVIAVQMDGIVTDDSKEKKKTMTPNDVAYRFEIYFLHSCINAKVRYQALDGAPLEEKALKLNGLMTPVNIRSVGWCGACGRTFTFRTYNFPAMQSIPVYSDDGRDVFAASVYEFPLSDPEAMASWKKEANHTVFRGKNPFRCPLCGHPYFDYERRPEARRFGEFGCVLLGRKVIQEE